MLLPSSLRKIKAQRTLCAPTSTIGLCWMLYASDNDGYLVESTPQSGRVVQGK
jgi:hypothetical protein